MSRPMVAVTVEQAYRQCAAVTEARAGNFKHAFVFLDRARRRSIEAAYAFSRRCDDISDGDAPVDQKRASLDEVRASLRRPPGQDSVMIALSDAIARHRIPLEPFDELIDGVVQDLDVRRYETFEELSLYCYRVASTVGLICIEIFGYEGAAARDHARDLGIAMQLTNIVRDIREDADRGRIYLPQEDLRRFGVREEDLRTGGAAVVELVRFQAARAQEYFDRGLKLLPYLSWRSRPCPAALAAIYRRLLEIVDEDPARVLRERVSLPSPVKKRLAFRAMVRALIGASGASAPASR